MFYEGQTGTSEEPKDTVQTQQSDDWLVLGERKYDKEAAATKIQHADKHISTLEQELADLRKQLELKTAQEEAKKAMSQAQTQTSTQPAVQNTTETGKDGTDLLSQVEQILQQRESVATKQTNLAKATEAAKAVYGDAYQQKLEETGRELGMSKADIVELASTKPQAFSRLFGLNTQAPAAKPSVTSTVTVSTNGSDDPFKSVAKTVLSSSSAKERTSAIAALLAQAKR